MPPPTVEDLQKTLARLREELEKKKKKSGKANRIAERELEVEIAKIEAEIAEETTKAARKEQIQADRRKVVEELLIFLGVTFYFISGVAGELLFMFLIDGKLYPQDEARHHLSEDFISKFTAFVVWYRWCRTPSSMLLTQEVINNYLRNPHKRNGEAGSYYVVRAARHIFCDRDECVYDKHHHCQELANGTFIYVGIDVVVPKDGSTCICSGCKKDRREYEERRAAGERLTQFLKM